MNDPIHLRRDLLLCRLVSVALSGATAASVMLQFWPRLAFAGSIAFACVLGLWLLLSVVAARTARLATAVPSLIAAGDLDQAEETMDQVRARFSPFRSVKLRIAFHLVMLRHAQQRWDEVSQLGRELTGLFPAHDPSARLLGLMRADASLQRDDLSEAHAALSGIAPGAMSLAQTFELLLLKLDYLARLGKWDAMLDQVRHKADIAELMPASRSALAQALLALAAQNAGRPAWADYLRRRVELLADTQELIRQRPALAALWNNIAAGG